MRFFVVIPGALVPAAIAPEVLREARAPALRHMFKRAAPARSEHAPEALAHAAHWHWLWQRFGGDTQLPVSAPYAWRALQRDSATAADDRQIWHAEPVHFAFARDHLLVHRLDIATLSIDERQQLAADAAGAVEAAGGRLAILGGRHWFIAFDSPWHLDTVPLDAAAGRSVQDTWPVGPDAPRWRKLLTEIQMGWHGHAVNAQREAAGRPAVNALWLHGGGVWTALPSAPFAALPDEHPTLRGWMLAAGRPPAACLSSDAMPAPDGDAATLRGALAAPAAAQAWGDWLDALQALDGEIDRLRQRAFEAGFASLELVLSGARNIRTVTVTAADRWRFWRRGTIEDAVVEFDD